MSWAGNRFELLYQDTMWVPATNEPVAIIEMSEIHLTNWITWAEQNSHRWFDDFFDITPSLRRRYISDSDLVRYGRAQISWLRSTPLYRKINAEIELRRNRAARGEQIRKELERSWRRIAKLEAEALALGTNVGYNYA